MTASILVVDDREGIRSFLSEVLTKSGYRVKSASDGYEASGILGRDSFDLLITDLKMPRMDGMELLKTAKVTWPDMQVIVLTAHGTIENAVNAMKQGAFDYLTKPLDSPEALRETVKRALEHRPGDSRQDPGDNEGPRMVASDPSMLAVVEMLKRVAVTDATVLLTGESGTGKEVAAREIHRRSQRSLAPFIAVNCAAISAELVESEMFGHEKGAFTGAAETRQGRFEAANGGTLFLDEVGELPQGLQAKLLRVLQERQFERVGGTRSIQVDARVIAATNRDLEQGIRTGEFREGLYHRLSVFPIHLPPLRKRPRDILPIARFLLNTIAKRFNKPGLTLDESAIRAISAFPWPGNVRELGNALERAAIMSDGTIITGDSLGIGLHSTDISPLPDATGSLKAVEREAIRKALEETDGHRKNAARLLGIGLRTLYNKIKEYDLE